jgi:hypothetical protein
MGLSVMWSDKVKLANKFYMIERRPTTIFHTVKSGISMNSCS